jgi:cupin 2 domain-containing protein
MTENLFDDRQPPADGERFETLATLDNVRIERIVSSARPESIRYVQEHDEWVVLLAGEAALEVDGQVRELGPGDYLALPKGTPHTVLRTSPGALWLAVHVHAAGVATAAP